MVHTFSTIIVGFNLKLFFFSPKYMFIISLIDEIIIFFTNLFIFIFIVPFKHNRR